MAEFGELAIEAVPARASLIAEFKPMTLLGEPARQLRNVSDVFGMAPMKRTSPLRPSSATVTEMLAL